MDPTIDDTENLSEALPTFTIAVRERHYPRDRLVLRVSRLRLLARLRRLSVRCLHLFTFLVPLLYQTSLRILKIPYESLRVARRFEYSVHRATSLYYASLPNLKRHPYELRSY